MNRHTNKKEVYELVNKIRKEIPDAVLRTTFMVGYQGETTEDFNEFALEVMTVNYQKMSEDINNEELDSNFEEESNIIVLNDEMIKSVYLNTTKRPIFITHEKTSGNFDFFWSIKKPIKRKQAKACFDEEIKNPNLTVV